MSTEKPNYQGTSSGSKTRNSGVGLALLAKLVDYNARTSADMTNRVIADIERERDYWRDRALEAEAWTRGEDKT